MKTNITLLFFLLTLLFTTSVYAQKPDTIHVFSHKATHLGGHGNYYGIAAFPPDTNSYRKVFLNFTIGCPSGGCSQWDYTVRIFFNYNTHVKDSVLKKAPTFTVNGSIKDTLLAEKDTTYITKYDSATHKTDSTANAAYVIVQYKDSTHPTTPTDTLRWWKSGYYNYYYDTTGHKKDSVLVIADTTVFVKYYSYYSVFDSVVNYEIARLITPYAGYYGKTWTYPMRFDITDFVSIMHDSLQVDVYYDGWSDGFSATCDFEMITGMPEHKAYKIRNMWTGSFPFGNASDPISNYLKPTPVKIDSAAAAVRLRILETGHGEDASNNCAEFCPYYQHVKINGKESFTPLVWRDDCGLNPLYHQAGTWLYDRANWCPGSLVRPYLDDLSPYITPNKIDTIGMDMDAYTSSGGAYYIVGATIVYYGAINYSLDAAIEDILTPNNYAPYNRFNPICGGPKVVIRNSGSTPLTNLDISYGQQGTTPNIFHWTGSLLFDQTDTVTLPSVPLNTLSTHIFQASISNPNGGTDLNPDNNTYQTTYTLVPNLPADFIIRLTTNHVASEYSYMLTDDAGHIIRNRSGFANNTTYRDTVHLALGCYHFELDDAGKEGLYFWADTARGSGSISFTKIPLPVSIINFQSDFGTSIIQNFTVNTVSGMGEIDQSELNYSVFPNPAKDNITISGLDISDKAKNIKIFSTMGELVYETTIPANASTYNINLASLCAGLYCITISNADGQVVKKVMVTR
jgi:hypothetical protein